MDYFGFASNTARKQFKPDARLYFCNEKTCPNLQFSTKIRCLACESEMLPAPKCLCGWPFNIRHLLSFKPENRVCEGCAKKLTDEYLGGRMAQALRDLLNGK